MCVSRKRKLYDRIPDWVWPHLTGDAVPAPKGEDYFSAKHTGSLVEVSSILLSRLAEGEERSKSVDSKLLALLTLTSVLSTVVAVSLAAATTLGTVKADAKLFAWFLVFYAALQILRSLWATVAGLGRRSYKQLSPADIVPRDAEANEGYRIRLLNLRVNHLCWNEWVVDQKVSDMAVAHTALRNALTAVSLLVVLTPVIAAIQLAQVAILPFLR